MGPTGEVLVLCEQEREQRAHFQVGYWEHILGILAATSEQTEHNPPKSMGPLHIAAHLRHLCSHRVTAQSFLNNQINFMQ